MLLDEVSSSVDAKTEAALFRNVFARMRGCIVIAAVHKLNLLPLFDTICVFERGRIVARGSLEQVRVSHAGFRDLWAKFHAKADASVTAGEGDDTT